MTTIAASLRAAAPMQPRDLDDLVARLTADGHVVDDGAAPNILAGRPIDGRLAVPITHGIAFDSREVGPGSLFVAVPGFHVDGHAFIDRAAAAGAVAAIVERPVVGAAIPQIVVASSQRALATASAWWYGDPSRDLNVVGITGTDGKTTTSFLAVAALEAAGVATGMIGTIQTKVGTIRETNAVHATTPEAPLLQGLLRAMVVAGDRTAVVETTSHGLALGRVDAIAYDIAVLTNLTHEHLELHGSFEAYRAAKLSLFERLGSSGTGSGNPGSRWPPTAVINLDDPSAAVFVRTARDAGARVVGFGSDRLADVRLTGIDETAAGLRVEFDAPSGRGSVDLHLGGRFNAHNALAVLGIGEAMALDQASVIAGLGSVQRVPGRMESIDAGQPFTVVVDYAHSPASLQAVLDELGPEADRRGGALIAVFGSAGERDRAKRPLMGRLAGERCRLVIVTDEDPRGEDREAILDEIAHGAEAAGRQRGRDLLLIADRATAIATAIERARPGDVVLLAGKGHEASIIGAEGELPWDEAAIARAALAERGFRGER